MAPGKQGPADDGKRCSSAGRLDAEKKYLLKERGPGRGVPLSARSEGGWRIPRFLSSHFFTPCFSFAVLRVSGGSLGAFGVNLDSFREPFWCHFCDF